MNAGPQRIGVLQGVALACVLGGISIGWNCAGASVPDDAGSGGNTHDMTSSSSSSSTGPTVKLSPDGSASSATTGASGGPDASTSNASSGCIEVGESCSGGGAICCGSVTCAGGMCGACAPEGTECTSATTCCDSLTCTKGYCGTNACVPDRTECGGTTDIVCCNDNCINGTCGGVDAGS